MISKIIYAYVFAPEPAIFFIFTPDPTIFLVFTPDPVRFLVFTPDPARFLVFRPSTAGFSLRGFSRRYPMFGNSCIFLRHTDSFPVSFDQIILGIKTLEMQSYKQEDQQPL